MLTSVVVASGQHFGTMQEQKYAEDVFSPALSLPEVLQSRGAYPEPYSFPAIEKWPMSLPVFSSSTDIPPTGTIAGNS